MDRIRILIVDDHLLFRQGLVGLLSSEPEFEVVGQAASKVEALSLVQSARPDVAVLDLAMPGVVGTELVEQVLASDPAPRVVVLTASEDAADLAHAIQAGATGYMVKNIAADSLFDAIRRVHAGGVAICDTAMPHLLDLLRSGLPPRPVPGQLLTGREQEVLELVAAGCSNDQIAARLVISEHTVKSHLAHMMEKFGVHTRDALIAAARAHASV